VLSKALKYAVDCELIMKSPKIGLYKGRARGWSPEQNRTGEDQSSKVLAG
jgi:hypothetical protein